MVGVFVAFIILAVLGIGYVMDGVNGAIIALSSLVATATVTALWLVLLGYGPGGRKQKQAAE